MVLWWGFFHAKSTSDHNYFESFCWYNTHIWNTTLPNWFIPLVILSISRTCCTKFQWCCQGLLGNSSKIIFQKPNLLSDMIPLVCLIVSKLVDINSSYTRCLMHHTCREKCELFVRVSIVTRTKSWLLVVNDNPNNKVPQNDFPFWFHKSMWL